MSDFIGALFGTREPKVNGNVFNSATHIAEAPKKKSFEGL